MSIVHTDKKWVTDIFGFTDYALIWEDEFTHELYILTFSKMQRNAGKNNSSR